MPLTFDTFLLHVAYLILHLAHRRDGARTHREQGDWTVEASRIPSWRRDATAESSLVFWAKRLLDLATEVEVEYKKVAEVLTTETPSWRNLKFRKHRSKSEYS